MSIEVGTTKRSLERSKLGSIGDKTAETLARCIVIESTAPMFKELDRYELHDGVMAHALTAGNRELHVSTMGKVAEHGSAALGAAEPAAVALGVVGSHIPMAQDSGIRKIADFLRIAEIGYGLATMQPYHVAHGAEGLLRSIGTRKLIETVKSKGLSK